MDSCEEIFNGIKKDLISNFDGVAEGKMMSSPAVQYNGKVFCFFYNESMCFKLGKDRDVFSEFGIKDFELLSPFKNKAPLGGWFIIAKDYSLKWNELAKEAYSLMAG